MQKSKKDFIVILSSVPFPYGNASDNAIFTFMSGFIEHGCDGEVVCIYPNSPLEHEEVLSEGDYLGVKYRYLSERIHIPKSNILHFLDFWVFPKHLLKKYIKRKCSEYNVSVLFVTQVDYRFYNYSKICKKAGARVFLVSCEYPVYLKSKTPSKVRKFRKLSKYIDKYIFETKTLDDYSRDVLQSKINSIVVPATMPYEDIVHCQRTDSDSYIAYCGSIQSESKDGLKNIIMAYSSFHLQRSGIKLNFIGRISNLAYYMELKRLVDQIGLHDFVSFTGEVSREEYVRYLTNAQLMIVAKPLDSYYGGGLSSKVIEYLFSGNPVVMVAADDYVHYLTHKENVYFASNNLPETLCAALCELFDNDSLREKIASGGKEYALLNFNYHHLTKGLLQYILK